LGVCADGSYSFKRGGFLHPYVTIRCLNYEDDFGKMEMKFGYNGLLQLIDGQVFEFRKLGFWKSQWAFFDESGEQLCTFTRKAGVLKHNGHVELVEEAKRKIHLPLIILVGWYAIILFTEEETVAAGAAAGSSH
jgi:hypothetical protein